MRVVAFKAAFIRVKQLNTEEQFTTANKSPQKRPNIVEEPKYHTTIPTNIEDKPLSKHSWTCIHFLDRQHRTVTPVMNESASVLLCCAVLGGIVPEADMAPARHRRQTESTVYHIHSIHTIAPLQVWETEKHFGTVWDVSK